MPKSLIAHLSYALIPLAILFAIILLACIFAYGVLMLCGDVWPLHKIIGKTTQLLLVLSVFPLRRYLNLSWSELGFAPKAIFFRQIAKGLGFGLLTLMPILVVLYVLGIQVFDESRVWTFAILLKKSVVSLLLAVLISIAEEPLFRGLLLTGLQKKICITCAVLLSSAYYAALHFLDSHTLIPYQQITFGSGFVLFNEAITNWFNPVLFSAFIGLFAVGIFLAVIRSQLTQSLGLCMGLHASWVWQIKLTKDFFNINYHSPYLYLVSNYDGIVGYLIAGWLLFASLVVLAYQRFGR